MDLLFFTPISWLVTVFLFLFIVGLVGFIYSSSILSCLIFIELALLALGVLFAALGLFYDTNEGPVAAITLISFGAAEAAVGLGFVIAAVLEHESDELCRLHISRLALR